MVSLQSRQTLDIFQSLFGLFHNLKQSIYESTLWVCESGTSQPLAIDLQEVGTLLILKIQFDHARENLKLRITPETVLVEGERLSHEQVYSEAESFVSRFQSLIPLPSSIQPRTAVAELNGKTLTLTLMKSYGTQQVSNLTVDDRGQLLHLMAISAAPDSAELN